jgi:hypothetical protein
MENPDESRTRTTETDTQGSPDGARTTTMSDGIGVRPVRPIER